MLIQSAPSLFLLYIFDSSVNVQVPLQNFVIFLIKYDYEWEVADTVISSDLQWILVISS